ncbi:hypothetical protein D3C87_2152520 [compost metagenome]
MLSKIVRRSNNHISKWRPERYGDHILSELLTEADPGIIFLFHDINDGCVTD